MNTASLVDISDYFVIYNVYSYQIIHFKMFIKNGYKL